MRSCAQRGAFREARSAELLAQRGASRAAFREARSAELLAQRAALHVSVGLTHAFEVRENLGVMIDGSTDHVFACCG